MTIAEQINAIVDACNTWGQNGGSGSKAEAATDQVHFFAILTRGLSLKPGAVRVAVASDGETPRGDIEELARVDRRITIGISRGRGMTLESATGLLKDTGAGEPLYNLAEEVREVISALAFDGTTGERVAYYKGMRRIEVEGFLIDALQLTYDIGTQLPVHGHN